MVGPHLLLLFGTGNQYAVFVLHWAIAGSLLPDDLVHYLVQVPAVAVLGSFFSFHGLCFVEMAFVLSRALFDSFVHPSVILGLVDLICSWQARI